MYGRTVGDERYLIGDDMSPYRRSSAGDALSPLSDVSANLHERYVDVYSPQQQRQDAAAASMSALVSLFCFNNNNYYYYYYKTTIYKVQ